MQGTQRTPRTPLLIISALLCCRPIAAGEPLRESTGIAATELEEARVIGKRLWEMREEMVAIEDRFYALYNQLNTNDDFDIRCDMRAWPNTLLKTRSCEVQYILDAQAAEAQAFLDGAMFNEDVDGGDRRSRGVLPDSSVAIARADEYRKTMLAAVNANSELRRLVKEREKLERDYERARRERFKERRIILEW